MEKVKFFLFAVVVLVLLGLVAYWSVATIQSGTSQATEERLSQLESENENLKEQVADLTDKLGSYQPPAPEPNEVVEPPAPAPAPATYKYQELISELEKMVKDNVSLKLKSQGTRVGTVQKFLNIYNDTSNKVDNDYGASTKSAVAAFQKAEGLPADGEAGPTTFKKMIEWLKKQG
jgi:murein L,D-transpeptidase YcbB/YkuD